MTNLTQRSLPWMLALLLIFASGCGGGDGGGGSATSSKPNSSLPSGDTTAPTIAIAFPTPVSMTEEANILVRGTATDDGSEVSIVQVNNIAASTTDGYANWQAVVPLAPGMNTISVSTTDAAGNTNNNAAQITVKKTVFISAPEGIAIDVAGNQALVIDSSTNALIGMDLTSGARRLISDNATPNEENSFSEPRGLALDSLNNRAFVADEGWGVDSLFSIDLSTGQRAVVATFDYHTFGIIGITYDEPRGRVLIATGQSISAADLASGATTVLSDHSLPDSQHYLSSVNGIVIDEANHRALVGDEPGIASVDLTTGITTTLFDSFHNRISPRAIALDSFYNRVLVTTNEWPTGANVTAIDLTTGNRSILAGTDMSNTAVKFRLPDELAVDEANNRVLVTDFNQITAVDLTNGETSIFSDNSIPDKSNGTAFENPLTMAFDAEQQRLFIADEGSVALVAVDLTTGQRTFISQNEENRGTNNYGEMVVDNERNRILLADTVINAIVAIDLTSGEQTIFSNKDTPGSIDPITYPGGLTLDNANNRLIVNDSFNRLVAVDLTSGIATSMPVNDEIDPGIGFRRISRFIVDNENNRAIAVAPSDPSVIAIDLTSGKVSDISRSASSEGEHEFKYPAAITWDRINNRVLVLDNGRVISVNLANGNRQLISPSPAGHNYHASPIIADPNHDRVYLIDSTTRSVVAVDLVSGARVIISK